jgi:hypothetical protein
MTQLDFNKWGKLLQGWEEAAYINTAQDKSRRRGEGF